MTGDARRKVLAANVADDTPEAEVELQLARLASRPTTLRTPTTSGWPPIASVQTARLSALNPTERLEVWT